MINSKNKNTMYQENFFDNEFSNSNNFVNFTTSQNAGFNNFSQDQNLNHSNNYLGFHQTNQNLQNLNNPTQSKFSHINNFSSYNINSQNYIPKSQLISNDNIFLNNSGELNFSNKRNHLNQAEYFNINNLKNLNKNAYTNSNTFSSCEEDIKNVNFETYSSISSNYKSMNHNNLNRNYNYDITKNQNFNNSCNNISDNLSILSGNSGSTYFSNAKSVNNLTRKVLKDEVNGRLLNSLENILPKIAEECAEYVYGKFKKEFLIQNNELEEIKKLIEKLEESILVKTEIKFLNEDSTPVKNLLIANENMSIIHKNLERKMDIFVNDSIIDDNEYDKMNDTNLNPLNSNLISKDMLNCENFFGEMKNKIKLFKKLLEKEKSLANEINNEIIDGNVSFINIKKILEDKIPLFSEKFDLLKSKENSFKEIIKDFNKINEKNIYKNKKTIEENSFDPSSNNENSKNIISSKRNYNLSKNNKNVNYKDEFKRKNTNIFHEKLNMLINNYSKLKNQLNNIVDFNIQKKSLEQNECKKIRNSPNLNSTSNYNRSSFPLTKNIFVCENNIDYLENYDEIKYNDTDSKKKLIIKIDSQNKHSIKNKINISNELKFSDFEKKNDTINYLSNSCFCEEKLDKDKILNKKNQGLFSDNVIINKGSDFSLFENDENFTNKNKSEHQFFIKKEEKTFKFNKIENYECNLQKNFKHKNHNNTNYIDLSYNLLKNNFDNKSSYNLNFNKKKFRTTKEYQIENNIFLEEFDADIDNNKIKMNLTNNNKNNNNNN